MKCGTCGETFRASDNVAIYRIDGALICELCQEEKEERA